MQHYLSQSSLVSLCEGPEVKPQQLPLRPKPTTRGGWRVRSDMPTALDCDQQPVHHHQAQSTTHVVSPAAAAAAAADLLLCNEYARMADSFAQSGLDLQAVAAAAAWFDTGGGPHAALPVDSCAPCPPQLLAANVMQRRRRVPAAAATLRQPTLPASTAAARRCAGAARAARGSASRWWWWCCSWSRQQGCQWRWHGWSGAVTGERCRA
jgi:hypothetical protein